MPYGDDFLSDSNYETTKAITIKAPRADVWPWLAQMGFQRGGLYSYDFLDRLFGILDRPSATTILPQYQDIETGDAIPMKGGDWPVVYAEPERFLVLGNHLDDQGSGWSWAFGLYEPAPDRTRLVSRSRAQLPRGLKWQAGLLALDAAALVMTRKMLLNIKQRAEMLRATRSSPGAIA